MDNEVSICCFHAVIRNCHTPFHFLVSLGLFACMRLSLEQNCKHQTGIQLKSEAVTRELLPPHGQKASGRYCDGPEHSSAAASCSFVYLSASAKFSFPGWSSGCSCGVSLYILGYANRLLFPTDTRSSTYWPACMFSRSLAPHSLRFLWNSLQFLRGKTGKQHSGSQFSSWMQKLPTWFLEIFPVLW